MFVTNWISPTKIQKISEITNFFRHYFLSRTEVVSKTAHQLLCACTSPDVRLYNSCCAGVFRLMCGL